MSAGERIKILIVDDEELICWSLKQSFEKAGGYAVHCAYTGDDALQKLHEDRYDIIITDLNLPDAREHEIVRKIKNVAVSTPVIVISADLSESVLDDISKEGVIKCIDKPFEIGEIMDDVEEAMRLAKLTRKN